MQERNKLSHQQSRNVLEEVSPHIGGAITYWINDHAHMIFIDNTPITGEHFETYADDMAECIRICNEDRHIDNKGVGHGIKHTNDEVNAGRKYVVEQLFTKDLPDFMAELIELERKIRVHKKWGGVRPVPFGVLFFDQDSVERLMTVGRNGDPVFQTPRKPILRGLVPTPAQAGAQRDKYGMGWTAKRHLKAETKLRRIK